MDQLLWIKCERKCISIIFYYKKSSQINVFHKSCIKMTKKFRQSFNFSSFSKFFHQILDWIFWEIWDIVICCECKKNLMLYCKKFSIRDPYFYRRTMVNKFWGKMNEVNFNSISEYFSQTVLPNWYFSWLTLSPIFLSLIFSIFFYLRNPKMSNQFSRNQIGAPTHNWHGS